METVDTKQMKDRKPTDKMKVTYIAFNQPHEEIFPRTMQLSDFANHMRGICNTWVLVDIQPTSKDVTINVNPED